MPSGEVKRFVTIADTTSGALALQVTSAIFVDYTLTPPSAVLIFVNTGGFL